MKKHFCIAALLALVLVCPSAFAQDDPKIADALAASDLPDVTSTYRDQYFSARDEYGEQSPEFAEAARSFGAELLRVHEFVYAANVYWSAIGAMENAGGTATEWYTTLINAGRAASLAGNYRDATGYLQQAIDLAEGQQGSNSRDAAMAHYEMAYMYLRRSPDALEGFGRNRTGVSSTSPFVQRQLGGLSIHELTEQIDDHLRAAERALSQLRLRNTMDYALVQALRGRYHAAREDNLRAEETLEAAIAQLESRPFVDDDLIYAYVGLIQAMQSRTLRRRESQWRRLIEHARAQSLRREYGEFVQILRIDVEPPRLSGNRFFLGAISYQFDITAEGRTANIVALTSATDEPEWNAAAREAVEQYVFAPEVRQGVPEGMEDLSVAFAAIAFNYFFLRDVP